MVVNNCCLLSSKPKFTHFKRLNLGCVTEASSLQSVDMALRDNDLMALETKQKK